MVKAKITTEETTVVNQIDEIPIKLYMAKGEKGDPGNDGQNGADGADGFSPTVETSKTGKVTTITITDVDGEHTATILDGADGQGTGDMLKATYDTNANGVVDNAEKVNSHTVEDDVPEDFFSGDATATAEDGTTVELTDAIKLDSVKLKGDTTQQTYTGKNLYTTAKAINVGAQTTIVDANSYTATVTSTWQGRLDVKIEVPKNTDMHFNWKAEGPKAGNSIVSYIKGVQTDTNIKTSIYYDYFETHQSVMNFNTGENTEIIIALYAVGNASDVAGDYTISNLQLEVGSSYSGFEPYVGGTASPNPDYPQDIQVVTGEQTVNVHGKNYWNSWAENSGNIQVSEDGTMLVSGIPTSNGYCDTGRKLSQMAPELKVGDTVYLYIDTDFYYGGYPRELIYCGGNWNNGQSKTITETMLNSTVVVYGGYQTTSHLKIMVTKALETTYEPYQSQDYTVNLGSLELCKIGTYQDYIYKSGDDWYVHKEIEKVTLDGSSEGYWYRNNNVTGADIYGFQLTSAFPNVALKNSGVLGYLSDLFISLSATQWNANIEGIVQMNDKTFQIHILRNRLADGVRETFINWLTTHNTTLYYALATPTVTQITDSTLIGQLEALENATVYSGKTIFANSGNLPATLSLGYIRPNVKGIVGAIPTVNDATLKIQANGTDVATFTANASENVTANIGAATTSAYGVTKLSSSTSSTSTTEAATPSAVKAAYDLANGKQSPLTAGTGIDITSNTISVTNIRYGTSAPSASEGNNGDIFIVYEE